MRWRANHGAVRLLQAIAFSFVTITFAVSTACGGTEHFQHQGVASRLDCGCNCLFMPAPPDPFCTPRASLLVLPTVRRQEACWGSTGRDSRGHIWLGVSTQPKASGSAHLLDYDPSTDVAMDRGDVVSAIERLGSAEEGDSQVKIHTKIVEAADGHLYFASTDQRGGDFNYGIRGPIRGGHAWRLRMPEMEWEHLFATPEGLFALTGTGRYVYVLGFPGHMLYQYDCRTGTVRSVEVGSAGGHFSRNILSDQRDHVYVPRLRDSAEPGEYVATLVEYDEQLRELKQTPLVNYIDQSPARTHGIAGFQPMADGSIVFVLSTGYLYRLIPHSDHQADLEPIGWMHPEGKRYIASMFTYAGERYVMGLATGSYHKEHSPRYFEWVVYDLETHTATVRPFTFGEPRPYPQAPVLLYGSVTRDDSGALYAVGRLRDKHPLVLRLVCP